MEGELENKQSSDLHALDALIQKWIVEAKLQSHPTTLTIKIPDSPLTKEIQEREFSRKFSTLIFDYYSGVSDPVQHIWHYRNKMVITSATI